MLLTVFIGLWLTQTGTVASVKSGSLYEFIKSCDKINAVFEYPSMRLAANISDKKSLAAHTPVVIRTNNEINTGNITSNDKINFYVVDDIKDDSGNIFIKSGSPVEASVTFEKRGNIGKSGKITITDLHTNAVDGTYVPLSSSIIANPDDKMVLSIILSVCICPLFLLIKGEEALVPAGTTKTLYTVSEVFIKTNNI